MKRLLILLFSLFACFTFAACAENGGTQNNSAENGTQTERPSESGKPEISDGNENDNKEITTMYLYISDDKLEVILSDNSSVDALVELLRAGDITYEAHDYGGFEKVGNIGHTLPRNDEPTVTSAGDVILYQGNNICLYYDTNSWDFTRIGKINGYSAARLRAVLRAGQGNIQVTISLK